jgi:hypothetical protein
MTRLALLLVLIAVTGFQLAAARNMMLRPVQLLPIIALASFGGCSWAVATCNDAACTVSDR